MCAEWVIQRRQRRWWWLCAARPLKYAWAPHKLVAYFILYRIGKTIWQIVNTEFKYLPLSTLSIGCIHRFCIFFTIGCSQTINGLRKNFHRELNTLNMFSDDYSVSLLHFFYFSIWICFISPPVTIEPAKPHAIHVPYNTQSKCDKNIY